MPGSITKRGKGSYRIRLDLPRDPITKVRRQYSETVRGTKKDAERRLAQLVTELLDNGYQRPSKETVAEYLASWLEKYKQGHRESTYLVAEGLVRNHIVRLLGDTKLAQLTPMQIDDLMIDMLKRGLRPRTARYAYWVLKTALDRAVETGRIRQNPASRVKPPREDARETLPLTEEQVIAFFREAHKSRLYAAFVLLLFSGLRRGELLGLEWNDIDFDAMTLHVRRALVRAKGGTRYTNGKTKNAERTVPLTREVIEVLRNHKELQDKERQRAGQRWKETGLVFTTKYGNAIYPDNLNSRYLAPILKRAGLEGIHPHKFRHTFATWCVSRGIDMKKVSRWLGHASEGFTWRQYHHLLPDKTVEEDARILSDVVFTGIRDQFVTNPASSVE